MKELRAFFESAICLQQRFAIAERFSEAEILYWT